MWMYFLRYIYYYLKSTIFNDVTYMMAELSEKHSYSNKFRARIFPAIEIRT